MSRVIYCATKRAHDTNAVLIAAVQSSGSIVIFTALDSLNSRSGHRGGVDARSLPHGMHEQRRSTEGIVEVWMR